MEFIRKESRALSTYSGPFRRNLPFILLLAVSLLGFVLVYGKAIPSTSYGWDESDYMSAVSRGFVANYLDRPAVPFMAFLKKGLGADESQRSSLSEYIRNSGSVAFSRHYHAPLFFYWVMLFGNFTGDTELETRWASTVCLIIAVLTISVGCCLVAEEYAKTAALLSSSLLLLGPFNYQIVDHVSPHSMYLLTALITLFLMAKLIQTNDSRYWYWTILALCLAFLTLEYAALLLLTLIFCTILRHKSLFFGWTRRQILTLLTKTLVLSFIIFSLAWPGGVFKLTFLKNYMFFGYYAVARSYEYGTQSFLELWMQRISASPVEYALMALSVLILAYVVSKHKREYWLLPFVIYTALLALTTLRNKSLNYTYLSSFLAAMYVIMGAMLAKAIHLKQILPRTALIVLIVLALFINNHLYFKYHYNPPDNHRDRIVAYLASKDVSTKIMTPNQYVSMLQYYFPELGFGVYSSPFSAETDLAWMLDRLISEDFDGWLYSGDETATIERQLGRTFEVRVDAITNTGSEAHVVYFQLDER